MRVGVCDYPSAYAFPPYGYGGIERWLWAVAVGAARAGAEVHLIGPQWRTDLPVSWNRVAFRFEDLAPGSAGVANLKSLGLDLVVVGHEYPSLPAWRSIWQELGCDVVTFQHDPDFVHAQNAFDGQQSRLFCYSSEMVERYRDCRPFQAVSVQFGLGEEAPPLPQRGKDLVWLGRLDGQKAPHLAAMAAARLGRRLRIIGKPVRDGAYIEEYGAILNAPHVELVGELAGADKLVSLGAASTFVYTSARGYVEAGAATVGEALRCGTPVAALAWRSGTCAENALCEQTGSIAYVDPELDDDAAAEKLAEAIARTEGLNAEAVQAVGLARFDPATHFRALAARP